MMLISSEITVSFDLGKVVLVLCFIATAVLIINILRTPQSSGRKMRKGRAKHAKEIVDKFKEECNTPVDKLKKVADDIVDMMNKGLKDEMSSHVKMLVTYVNPPAGDEEGYYYALDLGGTNFRVMRVKLQGRTCNNKDPEPASYKVPDSLKLGKLDELFDFMADRIAAYIRRAEGPEFELQPCPKREMGFTFSFPVSKNEINSGTLVKWTKGYKIQDAVGKDIVAELRKALEKQGLDINITALVNDTVGTLVEGRYFSDDCVAGVILGTGINAAYVEDVKEIVKLKDFRPRSEQMVVNMEWGNFWSSNLPLTEYDKALDAESLHPGEQIFEKMISGEYLGEIVRRALLRLADEAAFFGDETPSRLTERNKLGTATMSAIHEDTSPKLNVVGRELSEFLMIPESDISLEKRGVVVELCGIVATRGARLAAAALFAILKKSRRERMMDGKKQRTIIAIDGSLYSKYEKFRSCLNKTLAELLGKEVSETVTLEKATDGSGIGAAIVAASHSNQ